MPNTLSPGTNLPQEKSGAVFSMYLPLIKAADGLTLSQVCALTSLEPSTIQNWIKRGFVPHPMEKKYHERHLARILLINSVKDAMKIDSVGELMMLINGDTDDESDDIISEERLYDYLCACAAAVDGGEHDDIPAIVHRVTDDFCPPDEKDRQRVEAALTVMTYALAAGRLKQKAEDAFRSMRE